MAPFQYKRVVLQYRNFHNWEKVAFYDHHNGRTAIFDL